MEKIAPTDTKDVYLLTSQDDIIVTGEKYLIDFRVEQDAIYLHNNENMASGTFDKNRNISRTTL